MDEAENIPGRAVDLALASAGLVLRTASRLLLAPILLMMLVAGLSNFKDAGGFPAIRKLMTVEASFERPLTSALKTAVPTNFQGTDISRWIAAVLLYLISVGLGWSGAQCGVQAAAIRDRRKAVKEDAISALTMDREKLLEIYTQAKKTLESQKRPLAFLSVDVVDSTGIKAGEDSGVAERDFKQYKKLVERAFEARNPLKSVWTPDGVMVCFANPDDAVEAARELLTGLADFNLRVKAIKRDFAVRIGLNAGEVLFDESVPMEEMSDRVIDIAGHLQKHGSANAISASRPLAEALLKKHPFAPTRRMVDGLEVYEWAP